MEPSKVVRTTSGVPSTLNRFSSRWVTHPESAPATIQPASGTHSDRPGSREGATGNHGLILRRGLDGIRAACVSHLNALPADCRPFLLPAR